ncbi:AraC family transcriptional regulator, partial [Acinetobacter baumannii]
PRTLDRHLKTEHTSFRELARAARMARAMAMLDDTSLAITRIAYELGYSDAANFTRAMRRDAGMTPVEYRRQRARPTAGN